jgi:hypothetical protein
MIGRPWIWPVWPWPRLDLFGRQGRLGPVRVGRDPVSHAHAAPRPLSPSVPGAGREALKPRVSIRSDPFLAIGEAPSGPQCPRFAEPKSSFGGSARSVPLIEEGHLPRLSRNLRDEFERESCFYNPAEKGLQTLGHRADCAARALLHTLVGGQVDRQDQRSGTRFRPRPVDWRGRGAPGGGRHRFGSGAAARTAPSALTGLHSKESK